MIRLNPIKANMTELDLGRRKILFSYRTPVAAFIDGTGWVRTAEQFSPTTTRHINYWLSGTEAEEVPQADLEKLIA